MMNYYYIDITNFGTTTRHIITYQDGVFTSFPDVEDNTGSERKAYLDWVAEGNEASVWGPDAPDWPA